MKIRDSIHMNRAVRSILFIAGMTVFSATSWSRTGQADDPLNNGRRSEYTVVVEPDSAVLSVGETQQFQAYLIHRSGTRKDTTFQWSTTGSRNGIVDDQGVFTALKQGQVRVIASAGRLSGSAKVHVTDDSLAGGRGIRVVVTPHDTLLVPGETVQYSAVLLDTLGTRIDTVFAWSLSNDSVGVIDANGLFTAEQRGHARVTASAGDRTGWGHAVVVGDSTHLRDRREGLRIEVTPASVILAVGDTLAFTAVCKDTQGRVIDTTFAWSADGDFAVISASGLLEALEEGRGFVFATAGDLSGKAHVRVRSLPAGPDWPLYRLIVLPEDTTLRTGETVQFEAFFEDTLGNRKDTTVAWTLRGREVGTLTEDGYFTAVSRGVGIVRADVGRYQAVSRVMVASESDLSVCDSIRVRFHDREGRQVGHIRRIAESDILKISGLPFPLSILNGGELVLPPGSLDEGISIEITLPDLAVVRGDTAVAFTDSVIAGFSFDVMVDGILIRPYVFETPVQVVLPYKPEMMGELGLTIADFALFFYNEDGTFDDSDIFNVYVDSTSHKIYAEVAHFSQILFAAQSGTQTGIRSGLFRVPLQHALHGNYPNPFNPETWIVYDVSGSSEQHVTLTVYNLLGRRVATLVDRGRQPGHHRVRWNGTDLYGRLVASGVYLVRLEIGGRSWIRRMLLLR